MHPKNGKVCASQKLLRRSEKLVRMLGTQSAFSRQWIPKEQSARTENVDLVISQSCFSVTIRTSALNFVDRQNRL